jgi:large subunit ribosomal protein L25
MSMHATLEAQVRQGTGKGVARKLRAAGRLPAVVYGQGGDALAVTVDAHDARHLFERISVDNTIVEIAVDGDRIETLVREVQVHPSRAELLHVDFYRVQKGVRVEVEIPVHLNGTPVGVKSQGGVVQQVIHELPVLTIPSLIPDSFEVDVSALDVGDSIHVSDLELPEGVEVLLDGERTVCSVIVPKGLAAEDEEEEEAAEEGEEGAEPELVGEADDEREGKGKGKGRGGEDAGETGH